MVPVYPIGGRRPRTLTSSSSREVMPMSEKCRLCNDVATEEVVDGCYESVTLKLCASCAEWKRSRITCPIHGDVD